nr:unnamed protein product [Spirometra erinaceieuropaei]
MYSWSFGCSLRTFDLNCIFPEIDESGCLSRDEMVILGHFKMKMRADLDQKEDPTDGWSVRTCLLAKKLCERIEEGQQRIDALRHRLQDQRKQLEALKASSLCLKAKRDTLSKLLADVSQKDSDASSDAQQQEDEIAKLKRRLAFYRNVLNFRVARLKDNRFQFIFYGLSEDPEDVCYVTFAEPAGKNAEMMVDLVRCNPPISDIERLVNFLNQTGDYRSFLIVLRKRFQRYFQLRKAVSAKLSAAGDALASKQVSSS